MAGLYDGDGLIGWTDDCLGASLFCIQVEKKEMTAIHTEVFTKRGRKYNVSTLTFCVRVIV